MRRRLGVFLPFVLLAVLVQWLAPVSAFRVVATAWSDPLYMASICSGMAHDSRTLDTASDTIASETTANQTTANQTPASSSHQQSDCCAFCAGGHAGGLTLEPPAPGFARLQLQFQKLAWLDATEPMPTLRPGSNAQARAPPALS